MLWVLIRSASVRRFYEYPHYMFSWRNKKNTCTLWIFRLSGATYDVHWGKKRSLVHMQKTKAQISLCICIVWSGSSSSSCVSVDVYCRVYQWTQIRLIRLRACKGCLWNSPFLCHMAKRYFLTLHTISAVPQDNLIYVTKKTQKTRGPRATTCSPKWNCHCRYADGMQHFSNIVMIRQWLKQFLRYLAYKLKCWNFQNAISKKKSSDIFQKSFGSSSYPVL